MSNRSNVSVDQETKERFDRFSRLNANDIFQRRGKTNQAAALNVLLDCWDENNEEIP